MENHSLKWILSVIDILCDLSIDAWFLHIIQEPIAFI